MTFRSTLRLLSPVLFALTLSQPGHALPISGCANVGSPSNVGGVLFTSFTCNLYPTSSTYSIDLTSVMTQGGAQLLDNAVGAGYVVLMNGNPLTVSNNDLNEAALFNQSLWDAVLYFPADVSSSTSHTLTVDYPGAFPSASTVRTFDEALYGNNFDSAFFVQATGGTTAVSGGPGVVFNVNLAPNVTATPEPSSFIMLFSGMLGAGAMVKRRLGRLCANAA